jgi:hypothetical protein
VCGTTAGELRGRRRDDAAADTAAEDDVGTTWGDVRGTLESRSMDGCDRGAVGPGTSSVVAKIDSVVPIASMN